jgi:hypothetical protein
MLVCLALDQTEKISLKNGWGRYNQLYRAPTLKKTGTLCVLSGLARAYDGWIGHIATLPEKCRPALRLIFSVSAHDKSQRIDVLPSGQILWVDGAKTWVSFDGIRFGVRLLFLRFSLLQILGSPFLFARTGTISVLCRAMV